MFLICSSLLPRNITNNFVSRNMKGFALFFRLPGDIKEAYECFKQLWINLQLWKNIRLLIHCKIIILFSNRLLTLVFPDILGLRKVWWYQRCNHQSQIKVGQTIQWPKERGQEDNNLQSTTQTTTDRFIFRKRK